MAAIVIYDGQAITPAPLFSLVRETNTAADDTIIGFTFRINLKGKFVAHRGSPNTSQNFTTSTDLADENLSDSQKLRAIVRKQEALRKLFANEGRTLEILSWDSGYSLMACNPRVKSLNFPEGIFVEIADYEIILEADEVRGLQTDSAGGAPYLSAASEEWSLEETDEDRHLFKLTHTISATGKRFYDETATLTKPSWQQAQDWVIPLLGIDTSQMVASGVIDGDTLQAFNHRRSTTTSASTFSVRETWEAFAPSDTDHPVWEDYSVETTHQRGEIPSVRIQGTIHGLEKSSAYGTIISSKWENASYVWENSVRALLQSRAETDSNITIKTGARSRQINYNRTTGIISYSMDFQARFTTQIPGAIEESVVVSSFPAVPSIAIIPVLARAIGPVLQDTGTRSVQRRTISIEALMETIPESGVLATEPDTTAVLLSKYPDPLTYTTLFIDSNSKTFDERSGKFSQQVGLTFV